MKIASCGLCSGLPKIFYSVQINYKLETLTLEILFKTSADLFFFVKFNYKDFGFMHFNELEEYFKNAFEDENI
jgi:hypothetical protein